ncbi:MAG: hypothetical protein JSU04_07100 [Bdellovibrionales bacterium]|nr:hypothetical protein [Bdellovibrionales bacterium]
MNKDLFALVPNTYESTLSQTNEDIETFLNLEYQGQLAAEIKNPLAEKSKVVVIPKLITSIVIATTLLLAACDKGGYSGSGPANELLHPKGSSSENPADPSKAETLPNPIPKTQLVISGLTPLSSLHANGHIKVDMLIFEDWARLQTGGEDLEITANTIIAKTGLITNGDLGGHLKLTAKNLYGNLTIEASGTVSHPGTADVVIENMDWLSDPGYGCGIGARYNVEGNGHVSSMVIKNDHCQKYPFSSK